MPPKDAVIDLRAGAPARRRAGAGPLRSRLRDALQRRRARRAALPWAELEAEAARQGCSPADIFFDRAGLGVPGPAPERFEAEAETGEDEDAEADAYVPWRGLDPRPRA